MSGLGRFIVLTDSKHRGDRPEWLLWVGGYPRYFLVWGWLEDAIEEVAEWCEEHAPGLLYDPTEALAEAMAGVDPDDEEAVSKAWDAALADVTQLDCGRYILSQDWGIVADRPNRGTILALKKELADRYLDT